MTARRRLAATLTAASALLALTGCEKPAPIVTLVSGGQSVFTEATTWCFEGQSEEAGDCAERAEGETTLAISPGQQIGVDVGREVVERGWFVTLSDAAGEGEPQRGPVQDGHYFAFAAPNLGEEELLLTVRSLGENGRPDVTSGEWRFRLVDRANSQE